MVSGAESNELGTMENMRPYVIAMLFIIKFRLDVGSRLNCSAQIENEKKSKRRVLKPGIRCISFGIFCWRKNILMLKSSSLVFPEEAWIAS